MEYPFNLLTQYFISEYHIDVSKKYEVRKIPARSLIKYNRFDLMAKWIYIDIREKGFDTDFGKQIYYDNINSFSCGLFFEPGSEEKTSFEKFLYDFDKLIDDIKANGFNELKSIVPIGKDNDVLDGSHRVAVAAYYNQDITVIKFPEIQRTYSYDYHFFRKYLMSDVSMAHMARYYAALTTNCYMACLWPKADMKKFDKVEELLRMVGHIVYSQDVYLTHQGIRTFMTQIYGHQSWTGSIENQFAGVCGKVDACESKGQPVRTYLFEANSFEDVIRVKAKIRELFNIDNHSIHISDNGEETKNMVELLYNRNSVMFMNTVTPYKYRDLYSKLKDFITSIDRNGFEQQRFIIDSSVILDVDEVQKVDALGYLTDYGDEIKFILCNADNQTSQISYYGCSLQALLYDPDNFFYFEGMKFVSPERFIEMKKDIGNTARIRNTALQKNFSKKMQEIPMKFRFETLDKIYNYQVKHHIYGQGQWSYEQYKEAICRSFFEHCTHIIRKCLSPVSFVKNWLLNEKYRTRKRREWYIKKQRKRLKNHDATIISSNCNGGVIASDLGMRFNSPFVNLFIKASDYIKLLSDLKGYMELELCFVKEWDSLYGNVPYPTAYLGDVKIYFMHYDSEEVAKAAWNRRRARINWDNMYILFTDRSYCTQADLEAFDALPYEHKIVFTHLPHSEIKSSYYIRGYEGEEKVGLLSDWQDESNPVKKVYDQFDVVGWLNGEE